MSKEWRLRNKEKIKEDKRLWRLANKDKIKEIDKRFRAKHSAKLKTDKTSWVSKNREKYKRIGRKYNLKQYGLTEHDYDSILANQNYQCLTCKTPIEKLRGPLHVDHCHSTGKVRGLLCRSCNVAIGLIKEDVTIARAIISYIEGHNAGSS